MIDATAGFLEAAVRTATPLALAALGETISQRSGVVNVGLEGIILAGAFGALVGGYPAPMFGGEGSLLAGYAAAVGSGMLLAALFAGMVVSLRANQIIAGTALTLFAAGLTGTLYRAGYGTAGAALALPVAEAIRIPLFAGIPVIGRAFFAQPPTTLLLYLLLPLAWLLLARTHAGLELRAVGEQPEAAVAAGISPARVRWAALMLAGALGGLSGATLVLEQSGTFAEGISAGRGAGRRPQVVREVHDPGRTPAQRAVEPVAQQVQRRPVADVRFGEDRAQVGRARLEHERVLRDVAGVVDVEPAEVEVRRVEQQRGGHDDERVEREGRSVHAPDPVSGRQAAQGLLLSSAP